MKFYVTRTSDWKYKEQVEINTLEELIDFVRDNGDIIIQKPYPYRDNLPSIEIYDDWRE